MDQDSKDRVIQETMEIAAKLVELCRAGESMTAIETLYSDDILSIEPGPSPFFDQRMSGKDNIRRKVQWWFDNNELHSAGFEGPYAHGDQFIVAMQCEITPKAGPRAGQRCSLSEMGLYTVSNGKIVKEQFFQPEM